METTMIQFRHDATFVTNLSFLSFSFVFNFVNLFLQFRVPEFEVFVGTILIF